MVKKNSMIGMWMALAVAAQAASVSWDGEAADNNWTSVTNWSDNLAPNYGDDVTIDSASVNYDATAGAGSFLGDSLTLSGTATLTANTVIRFNGADVNVGSNASLAGSSYYDFNSSTVTFDAGATATIGNWEQKGSPTFQFNLNADGFPALTPVNLLRSTGMENVTYIVDLAAYTAPASNMTLVAFNNAVGLTDAAFQTATLMVTNAGSYDASLVWVDEIDSIVLDMGVIEYDVAWVGGGADNNWLTTNNWDNGSGTANGDVVGIGSEYTVNWNFGGGWHSPGNPAAVYLDGTLTSSDALRSWSTVWNIGSTANLDLGTSWLVFWGGGSSFIFDAGATLNTSGNLQFANHSEITLGFNLDADGFQALSAGGWLIDGFAGQTISVDMADFTGPPQNITLIDFVAGGAMTADTFTNFNLVVANNSGYPANLIWDEATASIVLDMGVIDYDAIWDDGASDSDWMSATNWNTDTVPGSGDTVLIGAGEVVTNVPNVFAKLYIGTGADVTFGTQFPVTANEIISDGQLDFPGGVVHLNGATLTLGTNGSLKSSMGWLDLLNGSIYFENGASFGNTGISIEHKGNNTIGFKLSETGFTTVQAGALYAGNNGQFVAGWSNATYNIDISEYNHTNGLSIVLADYTSVFGGTFDPTVNIEAGDSGLDADLSLNTTDSSLVLTIDPPGNDAPTAYDQTVTLGGTSSVAIVLIATDPEDDALTYNVVDLPTNGVLSGTAPNLTYTPNVGSSGYDTFTFTAQDWQKVSNTGTVSILPIPQTAAELWDTYHNSILNDPLNVEWLKSWTEDDITIHFIRYELGAWSGTQTNATPKIAAYYAYPTGGTNLPGAVMIHGGGQRAMASYTKYWAEQGYASISINWGGLPQEEGYPNTDWDGLASGFTREGVTDAIFHNWTDPAVYSDGSTLFDVPHPLNSSWMHNSYATRRALTFLQSQSIVDGTKLGLTGHSMGGHTTVLSSTDPRLTCVTPSVGGSGFLYEDWWGVPNSGRSTNGVQSLDLHMNTVEASLYWPDITCPMLFLEAANDFNAPFDLVTRAMALQPTDVPQQLAFAPHYNHRFDTASFAARVLWHKTWLTSGFDFPERSSAELDLTTVDGVPVFRVWPDESTSNTVVSVDIYYGTERDILNRFYRDAPVTQVGDHWEAQCPVYSLNEPLVALAVITYDCGFDLAMPPGYHNPNRNFSIASEVYTVYPDELVSNGVVPTAERNRLIDDFSRGFKDWYTLSEDNPHHWMFYTRKMNDAAWKGPVDGELSFDITTTEANNLLTIKLMDEWGEHIWSSFAATINLPVAGTNTVSLALDDFVLLGDGTSTLSSWEDVRYMGIASANKFDSSTYPTWWQGDVPVLENLQWVGGEWTFTNNVTSTYLESYDLPLNDGAVINDIDSDGLSTWEEEFAGTDPTNSASVLRVNEVSVVGGDRVVNWQAVAGKNYTVWFKTNMTDAVWIEQATGVPGVEPSCTHTVAVDSATGFVLIEVE
ncbi:hypothetical protein PDESU_06299 [Pontiella desulfatans]|uniref:Peptidase S9 prolyl oligopeptidase catalytic domain-containing protein n=1 Tax=Pontiella desulfatans TaxID=2750659 RepID=A0A6C2UDS7_PONDE|nr:Ig-like domain-containing protein [Pontiella desulfatans]VGO17697.1 hypothetical protein PDESU_06299 [Pontiella desulfatans]